MQGRRRVVKVSLGVMAVLSTSCSAGSTSTASSTAPTTANPTSSAPPPAPSAWTVAQGGAHGLTGWLDGVDCLTATDCVAVGNQSSPTGPTKALVETRSGAGWTASTAPLAPLSQGDYLFSVSCPAAGSCVAVGYFFTSTTKGSAGTMLIETLANRKWSVTPTPPLGSGVRDSFLYGVACTSTESCVAVGNTDDGDLSTSLPVILTLAHGTWSVTQGPSLTSHGVLLAVSCPSTTWCVATGYQATPSSTQTLIETLSGGNWSVTPSPGSAGPTPGYGAWGLSAISCVSVSSCVAVGELVGPGSLVVELRNTQWSAVPAPNPVPGDAATGLYGVSCSTATTCTAVGDLAQTFSTSSGAGALGRPLGTLIVTSSNGAWAVAPSPSGLPADSGLHAVSCVGPACVAVGQSGQPTSPTSISDTLIIETR
jgi:hypothetical protein